MPVRNVRALTAQTGKVVIYLIHEVSMTNAELEEVLVNLHQLSILQGRMLAAQRAMIDALLVGTGIEAPPLLRIINEESEVLQHALRDQLSARLGRD